jgi:ABC-type ATPase with predicted acetyltransferase domain
MKCPKCKSSEKVKMVKLKECKGTNAKSITIILQLLENQQPKVIV